MRSARRGLATVFHYMKDACGVFIHEEHKKTYKAGYLFRRSDRAMFRRFVLDEVDPGTGPLLVLRGYRP